MLLPRLAPMPPPSARVSRKIFDHDEIELNKSSRPSEVGEEILHIGYVRPGAYPHPTSFTFASSQSKINQFRRRVGGRNPAPDTSKKRRKPKAQPGNGLKPTRLRQNNPVKAELNVDIWEHIFQFTHPATLFALRDSNRFFRYVLSHDKNWQASRISTFGADMPGPPGGITEQRYCDLLVGNGCEHCGRSPSVRKVYWAFLKRWCNECYRNQTVREKDAKAELPANPALLTTIMSATRDSWGQYMGAGPVRSLHGGGDGRVLCYRRTDVQRLRAEYEAYTAAEDPCLSSDEKAAALAEWVRERVDRTAAFLEHVRGIEAWQRRETMTKLQGYSEFREQRRTLFQERVQEFLPQMTQYQLEHHEAYQRAIKISKPASERAWDLLYEKLK